MFGGPKNGKSDDKAHPPIHPVKAAPGGALTPEEHRIYDIISRHFLATLSKDAVGQETKVEVEMGGEKFHTKGLVIEEHNWLEIFPFEKWSDTYLPKFKKGEEFTPTSAKITEGQTQAPSYLSESDLIQKMDVNGIGTDATIHEHIKNIQARDYAVKNNNVFVPTELGVNLVEGYESLGIELYKPYLRAQMENDMKLIAQGAKSKDVVLRECISEMMKIFSRVQEKRVAFKDFFQAKAKPPHQVPTSFSSVPTSHYSG